MKQRRQERRLDDSVKDSPYLERLLKYAVPLPTHDIERRAAPRARRSVNSVVPINDHYLENDIDEEDDRKMPAKSPEELLLARQQINANNVMREKK